MLPVFRPGGALDSSATQQLKTPKHPSQVRLSQPVQQLPAGRQHVISGDEDLSRPEYRWYFYEQISFRNDVGGFQRWVAWFSCLVRCVVSAFVASDCPTWPSLSRFCREIVIEANSKAWFHELSVIRSL